MTNSLTILVIADTHYALRAARETSPRGLPVRFGLEWSLRAIEEACRLRRPDVIVLLGDVLDDGEAPAAEQDLLEFAEALLAIKLPIIAVPGNHDGDSERFLRAFRDTPGAHRIKGRLLYSFADAYAPGDVCTRPAETTGRFLKDVGDEPVIALQHNPLWPEIDSAEYPWMPANTAEILSSYERARVVLSLSGHYHQGQEAALRNGTTYLTCPGLIEPPFPFCLISIAGREAKVERLQLQMPPGSALMDGHVHTHFGYCAVDVHPTAVWERIRLLGVKTVAFTEHAGQLYLPPDDFWSKQHVNDPDAIRRARQQKQDRVDAYRKAMGAFRSPSILVGLEAECDRNGSLTLLQEDRKDWDVILGALHWLPDNLPADTPARLEVSFRKVTEQLITGGIQVLAHPFRYLYQNRMAPPAGLYRPIARLLAERGVAAEVNFRNNEPDPEFYRICLEEGARIVLGSDSHMLREVGDLHPHLRLLQKIGFPSCSGMSTFEAVPPD